MIIYKALNIKTGLIYIGQTLRSLKVRKAEHHRAAANILKTNPTLFHLAIREYGSAVFEWEVLETCDSLEHLNEREKFYINLLKCVHPAGYNQTKGGHMDSSMSEEIRDRIAESMVKVHEDLDYQRRVYPQLKGRVPPNKGVAMSDEQKAKVSAARKAVHDDPEYINPNIGQKRTGDSLKNVQEGHKRRKMPKGADWTEAHANQYTPEVREKMRQAKLGVKPVNTKQILCIETGQIFNGLTECAESLKVNRQSVFLQIKGKVKKVGGQYTFKYIVFVPDSK